MKRRPESAPSLRFGLRKLIVANTLLLAVSIGVGWSRAATQGARVQMARVSSDASEGFWHEAEVIFKANARVMAFLVLGACTLGMLTLVLFVWNGYLLGFGLGALHRVAPEDVLYILAYAPIEFAAFTTAAAASMHLALRVLSTLIAGEPLALRSTGLAFIAAVILLAAAAGVESCVKVHLVRTP